MLYVDQFKRSLFVVAALLCTATGGIPSEKPAGRIYSNQLKLLEDPAPLLADYPAFVQPIAELRRFEAPRLIDDPSGDLSVRAWRFSYNARGIIELPNCLNAAKTAIITVHPWGIDDGQGPKTPEPAGVAFACTPEKNQLMLEPARTVINPFLKSLRGTVGLVAYSLPGSEDPIRKKLYRSISSKPTAAERKQGAHELAAKLHSFDYRGSELPREIQLTSGMPAIDYFKQFPGLDPGVQFNNSGFWNLPIPVMKSIEVHPDDVVIYDAQGYALLKRFLRSHGIEHILLCGYHADMCVCSTTAGYENLRRDFNVFLVGDAVQSTLPANTSSRYATNQTVSFVSLNLFITQISWVHPVMPDDSHGGK